MTEYAGMQDSLWPEKIELFDFASLTGIESWNGVKLESGNGGFHFLAVIRGMVSLYPMDRESSVSLRAGSAFLTESREIRLLPALEGRGPLVVSCILEGSGKGIVPLELAHRVAEGGVQELDPLGTGVLHELGFTAGRGKGVGTAAAYMVAALLHGLAENALQKEKPAIASKGGYRRLAEQGAVWLAERTHCPIKLRELSAALEVSPASVSRAFKETFALTPVRYHLGLRHCEARRLLTGTNLPVKEISWRLGFTDQYDFSRSFRRCVGVSPRKFRQSAGAVPE